MEDLELRPYLCIWAAGFLDGEARFGLAAHHFGPVARIEVVQKVSAPLELLQRLFGGHVRPRQVPRFKEVYWHWGLTRKADVKRLLEETIPWLVVKRRQAELLLEAVQIAPYDPEARIRKDELYLEVRMLNARRTPIA